MTSPGGASQNTRSMPYAPAMVDYDRGCQDTDLERRSCFAQAGDQGELMSHRSGARPVVLVNGASSGIGATFAERRVGSRCRRGDLNPHPLFGD
jgi:hypothetical protein